MQEINQHPNPEVSYPLVDLLKQIDSKIDNLDKKLNDLKDVSEKRLDNLEQRVQYHSGIFKALGVFAGVFSTLLVWLHRIVIG